MAIAGIWRGRGYGMEGLTLAFPAAFLEFSPSFLPILATARSGVNLREWNV